MGLTSNTCNMNLKQCCANRILFLCIKHQLLGHIVFLWNQQLGNIRWVTRSWELWKAVHTKWHIGWSLYTRNLKTPNWWLQTSNRVKLLWKVICVANTLRQYQKGQSRNECTKSMSIILSLKKKKKGEWRMQILCDWFWKCMGQHYVCQGCF